MPKDYYEGGYIYMNIDMFIHDLFDMKWILIVDDSILCQKVITKVYLYTCADIFI